MADSEVLRAPHVLEYPYVRSVGPVIGAFLTGLREGRILGKGHATRDTVLWLIPVLWPIDLIMLPMRGLLAGSTAIVREVPSASGLPGQSPASAGHAKKLAASTPPSKIRRIEADPRYSS